LLGEQDLFHIGAITALKCGQNYIHYTYTLLLGLQCEPYQQRHCIGLAMLDDIQGGPLLGSTVVTELR